MKKKDETKQVTESNLYKEFEVEVQFRDKIYGGIPKYKDKVKEYVEGKFGEQNKDLADKLIDEVKAIEDEIEIRWSGFKIDDGNGLYMCDYHWKAMIKMAATLLRITSKKNGRQICQHGIFIKPPKIFLDRKEPDGYEEFAGTVTVFGQGKRSILNRYDYVDKAKVKFIVRMLNTGINKNFEIINEDELHTCFIYGQELGMLSCKSYEKGKYDLIKFNRID